MALFCRIISYDTWSVLELDPDEQLRAVEEQDDQIAEAVYQMRKKVIDRQHIPALTDKTFTTAIKDNDLLIVLFYLHCKY